MEVKIQTLTPLWTGGVNGSMDRIHETGIIGSMRWWYEAIVRGLGGSACDPSRHKCPDKDGNYCDVCRIFGATGRRRKFSVDIIDGTNSAWTNGNCRPINIRPPDRTRGWFLPPGRMGSLSLRLIGDEQVLNHLAALFIFLERWGSLGAKPQLGYGVFKIINRDEIKMYADRNLWQVIGISFPERKLPDFRRFGFFRYKFQPKESTWWTEVPGIMPVVTLVEPLVTKYKIVPTYPALKNEWRFHHWQGSPGDEKWIFGTLKWRSGDEIVRLRSKVTASWAYHQNNGWEVRGWGWMQKPKISDTVWDLLRDTTIWDRTLDASGSLETYPTGKWTEWTSKDVKEFLVRAI